MLPNSRSRTARALRLKNIQAHGVKMRPSTLSLSAPLLALALMTSACEVAAPVEAHAQPPVIAAAPTAPGATSAPTAQPVVEYECGMARQARLKQEKRWFKWPF